MEQAEIGMRRSIGPWALMLTGLGSMIGSGWLFGAWHAAALSGPAAIFSWVIGAGIILAIALTYVELGALFPESGGMVRYARYSHGSLVGFISAWANWISIVSVIPIEAIASVQYMASWPYPWAQAMYSGSELTRSGLVAAGALVIVYFLLNYWGVKLFVRSNTAITLFKFAIPSLTIAGLLLSDFHVGNLALDRPGGFAPYGWSAVFTAVATSGIVFSYNGFQSPVSLAGEARHPARSIPVAVIGAVLIALVLYVLLQVAFVGAVNPRDIAGGWHALNFTSPFAELALAVNLNWLAVVLYIDAFVSPSGTGSIYTATTARMIHAMVRNNTMPEMFGRIHPLFGVPRQAMWLNLAVSFIFMLLFRGWGALVGVISVATIISYLTGPISVMALRLKAPEYHRPVRIAGMGLVAPLAFLLGSLVLYWARWPLTGQLMLLMLASLPIFFYYQAKAGWHDFAAELASAWWFMLYLPTMALLSYLGSSNFGGRGVIPSGWDNGIVALAALGFYVWGVRSGRRTRYLDEAAVAAPATTG